MMRYGRDGWTIDVPAKWELFDDSQCITLIRPEGALQFSSSKRTGGLIDMIEIGRVASKCGSSSWGQSEEIHGDEFSGLLFDHVESNVHWRRWFLFQDSTLIMITFNSEVETSEQLWQEILAIVGTLRFEPLLQTSLVRRISSALRSLIFGRR